MRLSVLIAAPVLTLLFSLGQSALANPLPLTHPVVQQLLQEPGITSVLLDQGVIEGVAAPTLPGGVGVQVNCETAAEFLQEMLDEIEWAKDMYLSEYEYYDWLIEYQADGGEVTEEEFIEAANDIAVAKQYWQDITAALNPAIALVNSLISAAGC